MKKNNDPFGFKKAINTKRIDELEADELTEIAHMLDLSVDDFSDDKADLQDLADIINNESEE